MQPTPSPRVALITDGDVAGVIHTTDPATAPATDAARLRGLQIEDARGAGDIEHGSAGSSDISRDVDVTTGEHFTETAIEVDGIWNEDACASCGDHTLRTKIDRGERLSLITKQQREGVFAASNAAF